MRKIVVLGAGGFIGGALAQRLEGEDDHPTVRWVDVKHERDWHRLPLDRSAIVDRFDVGERSMHEYLRAELMGADEVYLLAADMGGMGFIEQNKLACMLSVRTSLAALEAAASASAQRLFYASSACVYPSFRQDTADVVPLAEDDAYPADPEDGYGWEKLFTERLARHFDEETTLTTRVARYHNVYGPHGTWVGGREKAPAAICRKVAEAVRSGRHEIEIWGDGEQTRSFMYIDDCVTGTLRIMRSDDLGPRPVNLGSEDVVTINELVSLVEDIAGVTLDRTYDLSAPQGVRGRTSDNDLIRRTLGWEPSTTLRDGLERTYEWVERQVRETRL